MAGATQTLPVLALLAVATVGAGAQTAPAPAPADRPIGAPIVFVPPAAGAPESRIGAATRDWDAQTRRITLLVPEGGGLTTLPQPVLVWHLGEPFAGLMRVEIDDTDPGSAPAGRASEGRFRAGLHALDLRRSEVGLEPGRIYLWTVTLAEAGSGRVVDRARALVERVPADPAVSAEGVQAAAAAGLWFDALAGVLEPTLAGRARLTDPAGFAQLAGSAGLPPQVAALPTKE